MMRSTRLQLWAASWNCPKRRTLPRPGAALKRAAARHRDARQHRNRLGASGAGEPHYGGEVAVVVDWSTECGVNAGAKIPR
jgi:hypothetical protein